MHRDFYVYCLQEKIVDIAMAAYVMESMSFLTAGIIDNYQEPDTALEAAIVKVGCKSFEDSCQPLFESSLRFLMIQFREVSNGCLASSE